MTESVEAVVGKTIENAYDKGYRQGYAKAKKETAEIAGRMKEALSPVMDAVMKEHWDLTRGHIYAADTFEQCPACKKSAAAHGVAKLQIQITELLRNV